MSSNTHPILTVSIAANLIKLHPRTLMLYEKEGLISPHRTSTKRRLYSFNDMKELEFIKYLTQTEGVNIKGVKIILEALKKAEEEGINMKKYLFPSFKPSRLN